MHQLESEEKVDKETEKVTFAVAIDEDLLRMIEASVQPGSAVEVGEEELTKK